MLITKKDVFHMLQNYLNHSISLQTLVEWAETAVMEHEFDVNNFDIIMMIISRLGLADVRAFGLTWEECESFINQLGYKVKLDFEYV